MQCPKFWTARPAHIGSRGWLEGSGAKYKPCRATDRQFIGALVEAHLARIKRSSIQKTASDLQPVGDPC
jgi:hypothetical protein